MHGKKDGQIVHALIRSANFSANGLTTPFREVLAETTRDTFDPLNTYLNTIIRNSILCDFGVARKTGIAEAPTISTQGKTEPEICSMVLYNPRTGEVQDGSGVNWGMAKGSHVNQDDASIPIRAVHIRDYPKLFPEKTTIPRISTEEGKINRHNDAIEIIWDDGETMRGLMEGTYRINDRIYPKQISSFPNKNFLGKYLRDRIGVPSGRRVTMNDLNRYGRTTIDISLQGEGIYFFDFSVKDRC